VTKIMAFGNAWITHHYILPLGLICSQAGIRPPAGSSVMPFFMAGSAVSSPTGSYTHPPSRGTYTPSRREYTPIPSGRVTEEDRCECCLLL
jgi:hypothetical protein